MKNQHLEMVHTEFKVNSSNSMTLGITLVTYFWHWIALVT